MNAGAVVCIATVVDPGRQKYGINTSYWVTADLCSSIPHMCECLWAQCATALIPATIWLGSNVICVPAQRPTTLRMIMLFDKPRYCCGVKNIVIEHKFMQKQRHVRHSRK